MALARSGGRRRSCNRCSAKKERCDGQEPCHRCQRSGLECLYATCRTLGRPRNAGAPGKRRLSATAAAAAADGAEGADSAEGAGATRSTTGSTASGKKSGGRIAAVAAAAGTVVTGTASAGATTVGAVTAFTGGTPTANTNRARAPARPRARAGADGGAGGKGAGSAKGAKVALAQANLKRPSLSPSPATGLTGLVQGKYLTCFMDDFACFFQVVDDSVIRCGLINLMTGKVDPALVGDDSGVGSSSLPPPAKRAVGAGGGRVSGRGDGSGRGSSGAKNRSAGRGGRTRTPSPSPPRHDAEGSSATDPNPDVYAINSAMFSAMAIGALLLGQTPSHVHLYVAVAKASLRLCSAEMAATPNERIAAAHLLLAFAAHVSGMRDYGRYIRLTRQFYHARVRRGLPTPTPISDILGYREIVDALGAPDVRGTGGTRGDGGGAIPPTVRESLANNEQGGGGVAGTTASAAEGRAGVGVRALLAEGRAGPAAKERARGRDHDRFPPGLEAARERARLRQAEPMLMVGDIMTMLSRVPWLMNEGEEARRTRQKLTELKSLVAAEKALAEERRFASRKTTSRTDRMSVFLLATAVVGLVSALDQFAELLPLAREVSACVCACPGLARYQPHSYHASLEILRAFQKQKEFNALLAAAPGELRRSAATGKQISYETREDMCSSQVCLKHAKSIGEMGRRAWEGERAKTHGRAPVEVASDANASVVAVAVKAEPEFSPAGGKEGDPEIVVSRVASNSSPLEERCQLPGETTLPADSVAMVSPPLRPQKTPGIGSTTADAASPSSATASPTAATNLPKEDSPDSVGQWTPEFPPSLGASVAASDQSLPSRTVGGGSVATFDCAPRGGEGALMGGLDGDNNLLLLQPPLALRSSGSVQGADTSAFASAAASAAAASTPASSSAAAGTEPHSADPRSLPSRGEGADWNGALAGGPYRGVGGGASGVSSGVSGAAASYSIAGDVGGTTRHVAGGGGGGGSGSGSSGGTDAALANPLLSGLRLQQARSVALYGVTANGPVLDSACPLAAGQRVASVGDSAGAAGAASAAGAGGSSADEGAGVSAGLPGPHRDWRGRVATSAPGPHLAPLHQPANVVAAGLGARLPSAGGALTRRLWDSPLASRHPSGGVEFVSPHRGGAANLPLWRWERSVAPHPPLLPGPVARRVVQPVFPPDSLSFSDSPMFSVSGGPAASALAVAAAAAAAEANPTPAAMAPAVMAPSSSSYLLARSTSMSAGAASAAAISSAAARSSTANPSMRGCGDAGGGGAPHCEDADETSLDTGGIGREEGDEATRDLWEIIGAADGSE
eukprot:jgi/Undpi1/3302/HiC_scaffold_15.g06676.m1